MPDWWDQDEGNDGLLDVNDLKIRRHNQHDTMWYDCWSTDGVPLWICNSAYAVTYQMPLTGTNAQFGSPYSTRPDAAFDQGAGGKILWACTPGAQGGCWLYDFGGNGDNKRISYTQIQDNRDAFITWIGLLTGIWQWNFDDTANAATVGFPDELGADLLKNAETGMLMVILQTTRSV